MIDLEGLEESEPNPVVLFEVKAEFGPPYSYELTTVEIDQTDLIDSDGDPVDGMCLYDKRRVLINAATPEWKQKIVTLHEMLHTLFEYHGIGFLTPEREEEVVTFMAPRLFEALQDVGFSWPKRSKAANALCRQTVLDSS